MLFVVLLAVDGEFIIPYNISVCNQTLLSFSHFLIVYNECEIHVDKEVIRGSITGKERELERRRKRLPFTPKVVILLESSDLV